MSLSPRSKLVLCLFGLGLPALVGPTLARGALASSVSASPASSPSASPATTPAAAPAASPPSSPSPASSRSSAAAATSRLPRLLHLVGALALLGGLAFAASRLRAGRLERGAQATWRVGQRLTLAPRTYLTVLERGELRCTLVHGDAGLQLLPEGGSASASHVAHAGPRPPRRRGVGRSVWCGARALPGARLPS